MLEHAHDCLPDSVFVLDRPLYLLLQYAVEDEDKHALQGVENGEEVGHDNSALIDVHQSKSPG